MYMKYYSNIVARSYRFYARFKKEAPYMSSLMVLCFCEITLTLLLMEILINVFHVSKAIIPPKAIIPFMVGIWIFLTIKIYPKKKVETLVDEFGKQSKRYRRTWAIITFLSFALPIILIFIFAKWA